MTTAAMDSVTTEQILAEARQVKFSRVLLMIFLGLFWGVGWVTGRLWLGTVFCAISVRRGWRDGAGYSPPVTRNGV